MPERRTTVISVRGKNPAELLKSPDFVYCGRQCAGWSRSIWGNPWKYPQFRDARDRFEDAIRNGRSGPWPGLRVRLPELRGKVLGCWCGDWEPGWPDIGCHAVVLARLADLVRFETRQF